VASPLSLASLGWRQEVRGLGANHYDWLRSVEWREKSCDRHRLDDVCCPAWPDRWDSVPFGAPKKPLARNCRPRGPATNQSPPSAPASPTNGHSFRTHATGKEWVLLDICLSTAVLQSGHLDILVVLLAQTTSRLASGTRLSSETVTEGLCAAICEPRFDIFCRRVALLPWRGKPVRSRLPVSREESKVL
jgi:hypothetical protein